MVGHSYGGPVISGVVDRVGNKIKHQVYIDCAPVDHGENTLDVFGPEVARISMESAKENGDGWLITADALREPISTMSKHPLKSYLERVDIVNNIKTDGTIILATEAMSIFGYMRTTRAPKKTKARGWEVITIEGPHTLQEQDPSMSEISKILVDIYDI